MEKTNNFREVLHSFQTYRNRHNTITSGKFNPYSFGYFEYNKYLDGYDFQTLYNKCKLYYETAIKYGKSRKDMKKFSPAISLNNLKKSLLRKANGNLKKLKFKISEFTNGKTIEFDDYVLVDEWYSYDFSKYNYYVERKKTEYIRPHFGFIDIDIGSNKNDFIKDYKNYSFRTYEECKLDFFDELSKMDEVVMYGSSSGGQGIRIIYSYDYDIIHDSHITHKDLQNWKLNQDLHYTASNQMMMKLQTLFNIRILSSYQDTSANRITQPTFYFGLNDKNQFDLVLKKYKPFKFKYNYNIQKTLWNKKTEINEELLGDDPVLIKKFLKLSSNSIMHNKEEKKQSVRFNKAFVNYMNNNLFHYEIGKHNVILSMLANIDNDEMYEYFWKKHKASYIKYHGINRGGLSNQISTITKYKKLCRKSLKQTLDDNIYPLSLYNFLYGDKYLSLIEDKKIANIGL